MDIQVRKRAQKGAGLELAPGDLGPLGQTVVRGRVGVPFKVVVLGDFVESGQGVLTQGHPTRCRGNPSGQAPRSVRGAVYPAAVASEGVAGW